MGRYVPSTKDEQMNMLKEIGLSNMLDLYSAVPKEMLVDKLDIPEGKNELAVHAFMQSISEKNKVYKSIFRGAGAYRHYIPSIVKSVVSKEEFITAYTPYQAEISQGLLQGIFEFQTMICELTGMDAANASVYDGASAASEAMAMCVERKRTKVLVSATSSPFVVETMKTYAFGSGAEVILVPEKEGITDFEKLNTMLDETVACVYIAQPNFYGLIEDAEKIADLTHDKGAKFVMGVNPLAATLLKSPKECGADIAVGEAQPLGIPLSFGGPYLGFMTCVENMMRKLPGRIVGETTDTTGKRAYVLTLQAREQHIRREKATSNLCTNQALCALTASVYMSAMGAKGIKEVAEQCVSKAHYAAEIIGSIKGFELKHKGEFFHEFLTNCPVEPKVLDEILSKENILGGYATNEGILWCATEMISKEEIDKLAVILREVK